MNSKRHYWERRLARFGLATYQFRQAGIQQLTTNAASAFPAHDVELRGAWWGQRGVRRLYSYADLYGMHRVAAHKNRRKVPDWALSNSQCRDLILRLYPRLLADRRIRNRRDMRHARGLRHMAAITALVLYRAYRQLLSDREIADELGISPSAVSNRLDKLNRTANELFGEPGTILPKSTC